MALLELGRLLGDQTLREELAGKGREVAADHTIEANAWRTWEAWEEALQRRRADHARMATGA